MKKIIFALGILILALSAGPAALAAAVETVSLGGVLADHTGPGAVQAAIGAVSDGGEVQILEAGDYGSATIVGGKSYSVTGMVAGVTLTSASTPVAVDASAGAVNATIDNISVINNGFGSAMTVQQDPSNPISLTIDNSRVSQTNKVGGAASGGEGLTITPATAAPGGVITLKATLSTFETLTSAVLNGTPVGGDQLYGINVNGVGSNHMFDGLNVTLTSCTVESWNGAAIQDTAGDSQVWNIENSSLLCHYLTGRRNAFVSRSGGNSFSNCQFNFTNSYLYGPGETIMFYFSGGGNDPMVNNRIVVRDSIVDNRRFGVTDDPAVDGTASISGNQPIRVRFNYTGIADKTNSLEVYNSVILSQPGTDAIRSNRATAVKSYFNTIVNEGAGADPNAPSGGGFNGGDDSGSAANIEVANCLFVNVGDPVEDGSAVATGNVVANATADDANAGAGHVYVTSTAALLLDADYIPQAGSPAIGAADAGGAAYLSAVNGKDKRGFVRDALPDAGAFEFGALPPVNAIRNWVVYQ